MSQQGYRGVHYEAILGEEPRRYRFEIWAVSRYGCCRRRLTNWRRWSSLMFRICRGVNRDMIPHFSSTYVSVYRALTPRGKTLFLAGTPLPSLSVIPIATSSG